MVKVLDPITQLMIYYRQGDMKSFDSDHFTNIQKYLAMFLLGKVNEMRKYLPNDNYLSFISMMEGNKIDQISLDGMLIKMARRESVKGVSMMLSKGADIHTDNNRALILDSEKGYLDVVKYLVEHDVNIHGSTDGALRMASLTGHLEVVKYLVEHGANIHAGNDYALRWASNDGYLELVKYLVEKGANIHADTDGALRWARGEGHLDVVEYLKNVNN